MTDPSSGASTHRAAAPDGGEQRATAGQAKDAATDVAKHGKQAAADVAGHGKQAATDVASTAQDAARDVAKEVGAQANDLMGRTREQLREQVETQRVSAVTTLRDLGEQLAALTDDVDADGTVVDAAVNARDRVRGAATWLDERDPDEVLAQLRRVGRQRPGAFLLTAAVAGVLAGRLTRGAVAAHAEDTNDTDDRSGDTGLPPVRRPQIDPPQGRSTS